MTTEAEHDEWIATREAAVLLGLSYRGALNVLHSHQCTRRTGEADAWRRADVVAILELRTERENERPVSTPRGPDWCDAEGAARIKAKIEAYWAERGASVSVKLVDAGFVPAMRSTRFDVRSNMRNGWPAEWSE